MTREDLLVSHNIQEWHMCTICMDIMKGHFEWTEHMLSQHIGETHEERECESHYHCRYEQCGRFFKWYHEFVIV